MAEFLFEKQFGDAVRQGKQIDAIKLYREFKDVGLREAAAYVQDNWVTLRAKYCEGE